MEAPKPIGLDPEIISVRCHIPPRCNFSARVGMASGMFRMHTHTHNSQRSAMAVIVAPKEPWPNRTRIAPSLEFEDEECT